MLLLVNVSVNSNMVNGSIGPKAKHSRTTEGENEMSLLAICCVTIGAVGLLHLAWVALKPLPEEIGERGGERKHIVEGFLAGLAEEFGRLQPLMTVAEAMSAAEPWMKQFERAGSRFEFRVYYRIASLQIHTEKLQSTKRLARLTELVGNLSERIEVSMARLVFSGGEQPSQIGRRSPADPD